MYLLTYSVHQIPIEDGEMQQILRLLQLNLFEKRDLMALLRGDPLGDKQPDISQLALI